MLLASVSTITAIAVASAVIRPPATKGDGWKLHPVPSTLLIDERVLTDQPILSAAPLWSSTTASQYTSAAHALDKIEWLKAELESYKSLTSGWDGEGSLPADGAHIYAAGQILSLLPAGIPLPKPMLSADGEVGLYWKSSEYLADAVIEDADHFSFFIRSLKDGNQEIFIPSLAIGAGTPGAIAAAFLAA